MNIRCLTWVMAVLAPLLVCQSLAQTIDQMEQSTVRITTATEDREGQIRDVGSGSGFVLPGNHIVTNAHVATTKAALIDQLIPMLQQEHPEVSPEALADRMETNIVQMHYFVELGPTDYVAAEVLWQSVEKDLSVLRLLEPIDRPPVTLTSEEQVYKAQPVFVMGFPGIADRTEGLLGSHYEVKITRGIISAIVTDDSGWRLYQTDAAINPGNSGGPLFNECGEVVGITVQKALAMVLDATGLPIRVPEGEGIGWSIRADELLEVLPELGIAVDSATTVCALSSGARIALSREVETRLEAAERRVEAAEGDAEAARQQAEETMAALATALAEVEALRQEVQATDPWMMAALIGSLLLGISALLLALTQRGRGMVRHAVHRTRPASHRDTLQSPSAHRPLLRGLADDVAATIVECDDNNLAMGRDPNQVAIVLPGDTVSKHHARLRYDQRERVFLLEDCWSTNGTFLDSGERLKAGQAYKLHPGTRFYLGNRSYLFEVQLEPEA